MSPQLDIALTNLARQAQQTLRQLERILAGRS